MKLFSKQIDKRIAAYQRELIETHYVEVGNMYKQIRGWRHDYRNHIQVMKAHAASGDMVAVKKYLDELEMDLATVDTCLLYTSWNCGRPIFFNCKNGTY